MRDDMSLNASPPLQRIGIAHSVACDSRQSIALWRPDNECCKPVGQNLNLQLSACLAMHLSRFAESHTDVAGAGGYRWFWQLRWLCSSGW